MSSICPKLMSTMRLLNPMLTVLWEGLINFGELVADDTVDMATEATDEEESSSEESSSSEFTGSEDESEGSQH